MVWPTADIPTYGRGVWLECNGQSFSTTQFPQLYQTLGTNRVPNYQGMFLRGYGSQNFSQLNGTVMTFDDPVLGPDGKLTYGQQTNTTYASENIGEIQGDSAREFVTDLASNFFQMSGEDGPAPIGSTAYRLQDPSPYGAWAVTVNPGSNPPEIRAWGHFWHKFDAFLGDIFNQKRIFFTFAPKHYKYRLSGSGEDGYSLEEYTEPADSDEGFYTYAWASDIAMQTSTTWPTANEFRPVNVAVKFMIKAK